jgi:hypothetical protein
VGGFSHLQVTIISLQREIDGYKVTSTYITKFLQWEKELGVKNSLLSYPFVLTWQLPLHFILKIIQTWGCFGERNVLDIPK